MTGITLKQAAKFSAVLLAALGLKYHYSVASENELRWILAPTTVLVELLTGIRFAFESYAGYMSSDNTFLIARSCSGVNFLIIAFLLLTLFPLWQERELLWRSIPLALIIAYLATLGANTTRIVIALWLQRSEVAVPGMSAEQAHRLEGIIVYFVCLLILFVGVERKKTTSELKYLLLIYYGFTLGIPIVRGSFLEYENFWEHLIFVVFVPIALVLPLLIFRLARGRFRRLDRAYTIPPA